MYILTFFPVVFDDFGAVSKQIPKYQCNREGGKFTGFSYVSITCYSRSTLQKCCSTQLRTATNFLLANFFVKSQRSSIDFRHLTIFFGHRQADIYLEMNVAISRKNSQVRNSSPYVILTVT